MDPQKITALANLLRNNGDKILSSEFKLTLSGSLLRALNDSFTLIADSVEIGAAQTFQVVKPINLKSPVYRDLQLVHDFVQKTTLLCIVHYNADDFFEGVIDVSKFKALKRLEVQKTDVSRIVGLQPMRSQLQELICVKSLHHVGDIITHCGGDKSNGFVWNELRSADFSYNNLQTVDNSLEFAQYLQHLNLRHNQLISVEAVKWLPHLKTLDLSFNRLQLIPQIHAEASKRLQKLNISNNFVEDLMGSLAKMESLTNLDLADNCLMDHSCLLPLSALVKLNFLNLSGNPLYYHPKHRLATAQFLHKNAAVIKFTLDFAPLSKNEKTITGTQQMRPYSALSRFAGKSSSASISSDRVTPVTQTPASSVGSLRSFKLLDATPSAEASIVSETKKRVSKVRTVEIQDQEKATDSTYDQSLYNTESNFKNSSAKSVLTDPNTEHLAAKKQIEILREKYGSKWLETGNAEMMNSVLGIETPSELTDQERNNSRKLFHDYIGEWGTESVVATSSDRNEPSISNVLASTPTKITDNSRTDTLISPIKATQSNENNSKSSFYMSLQNSSTLDKNSEAAQTFYESASDSKYSSQSNTENANVDEMDEPEDTLHLQNVYSAEAYDEPEVSEAEDSDETYIVHRVSNNETLFLTISTNFLREKDTCTQKTKAKWSIQILESCDRIKSNMLRINFDTVKKDKQERVYTIEEGLCQELERKLRSILSTRDLTEMNQTMYRCVNCTCQFSRENTCLDIRCPTCKSAFVAEINETSSLFKKSAHDDAKLSPAAIVEESPVTTPLIVKPRRNDLESIEETNSIGSANSLNESSSCSKITNSHSSFDSNQSVVGSSTADRDIDFKSTGESDVDILSNPSQSSIEVLEQPHNVSRKTSEERRMSQTLTVPTAEDPSNQRHLTEMDMGDLVRSIAAKAVSESTQSAVKLPTKPPTFALANLNLTESSSSGSVTDSVCTAYEQQEQAEQTLVLDDAHKNSNNIVIHNIHLSKDGALKTNNASSIGNRKIGKSNSSGNIIKKDELRIDDPGISSVFGSLFQSTNILMSSSKKMTEIESELNRTTSNVKYDPLSTSCRPYKFNYTDFNDVDHRLKLFFYQTKFEEQGEHFKCLARGRIYNENTRAMHEGIVVLSTYKCYIMEAYAPENDDVSKWLRQVVSLTVDRLECIQLLPWKIGVSFLFRDWGGILLLLQDILRTDSLLLHFQINSLPSQCEVKYQPAEEVTKRLTDVVIQEKLQMCSIINSCEINCENANRSFKVCGLLTTDTNLYLTSNKLDWLSTQTHADGDDKDIELCVTQFMCNLVEVVPTSDKIFTINFLDETHNKYEHWTCTFETEQNASSCLNAIGQSWEELFGVPLFNA